MRILNKILKTIELTDEFYLVSPNLFFFSKSLASYWIIEYVYIHIENDCVYFSESLDSCFDKNCLQNRFSYKIRRDRFVDYIDRHSFWKHKAPSPVSNEETHLWILFNGLMLQ